MFSTKKIYDELPWKLLTIEALLVVFSVLLALGINSWRQTSSHQELAQRALKGIVEEAETNCSRIQAVQSYHQAVANDKRQPGGIQVGLLRNQAWDAAKTIGAAPHLDYEIVALIEEINANQSDHRFLVKSYGTALYTVILQNEQKDENKSKNPEGERAVIGELVLIQTWLLEDYQNLSKLVEKHYDESIDTSKLCKEN